MRLNILKIEKIRIAKGISKATLAQKAGISKQLLHYYYKNPSGIKNVSAIAKALDMIDPRDLLI